MKEYNEEPTMNLSKNQRQFLKLVDKNSDLVFEALSDNDILKVLIWKDSRKNGGKLGYRGIANKYGITENKVRWILSVIIKNNEDADT